MKKIISTMIALTMIIAVMVGYPGTANDAIASSETTTDNHLDKNDRKDLVDFSLDVFEANFAEDNVLISPLSIISALGMVTNGATGDSLAQMESVMNIEQQTLNEYISAYGAQLPNEKDCRLGLANAIWYKQDERLTIEPDFAQAVQEYYQGELYQVPFDDSTKEAINAWVNEETDGLIDTLLEEPIPEETIMYLINALSFDAKWEVGYEANDLTEWDFTLEDGEQQPIELMRSTESAYLENDQMTGVIKPYKDHTYALVALLPKEDVSMKELVASFKDTDLMAWIEASSREEVLTGIPKFALDYEVALEESLQALGMVDIFDAKEADLTHLGTSEAGNLFIDRVLHKTTIEIDEEGTQAGAVTSVVIEPASEAVIEEPKEVLLDRPFFYLIVDTEHYFPLFMGSFMEVE